MYRTLDVSFWTDPKVESLIGPERYFLSYLILNRHTHVCGLYYLPKNIMEDELGHSDEKGHRYPIEGLLKVLIDKKFIKYDEKFKIIWVKNMFKRQGTGEKMIKAAINQFQNLHKCPLINDFIEYYPEVKGALDDDFEIPLPYPIDTLSKNVLGDGDVLGLEDKKRLLSTPGADLTDKKEDDPKEPEEPKNDIPYEDIGELWNTICGPVLSRIKEVTPGRRQKIKTRWNFKGRGDLVFWKDLFCAIAGTPFLLGDSNQGWKASFDWVMNNNENAAKVLEGNYVKQKRAHPECHIGSGSEPGKLETHSYEFCPNAVDSYCEPDCPLCGGKAYRIIDDEVEKGKKHD